MVATIRNDLKELPVSLGQLGQLGQLGLGQTIGGWDIGGPYRQIRRRSLTSPGDHARFRARDTAGLSAFLVSALARLPSIGSSISFWPTAALRGFLPFAGAFAGNALLQGVHKVHNVPAAGPGSWTDGLALALRIDEYGQCLFVVILKSLRFEIGRLLADDMLRQIKHILRNFHVLDLVEVCLLVPNFVGVSQKRAY
jgi:hypothetical protein